LCRRLEKLIKVVFDSWDTYITKVPVQHLLFILKLNWKFRCYMLRKHSNYLSYKF
jgi:hypothetical protein